ncbi:unnamed protein product [Rotaria sp. Silwood1]|nr:unnamed protein product [Rotaria sp. Silwood1]
MLTSDGRSDIYNKGADAIRFWSQDGLKTPEEYMWPGVSCNGCQMNPLIGQRYTCSTCNNFNVCSACHEKWHEHELTIVPQTLTTIATLVWKGVNLDS